MSRYVGYVDRDSKPRVASAHLPQGKGRGKVPDTSRYMAREVRELCVRTD